MSMQIGLENCLNFINSQLQTPRGPVPAYRESLKYRAITISRQSGSGGHSVAQRLLELFHVQPSENANPWAVFDRNLVEKVLEHHHLPNRLARFMAEDRISEISDT